MHLQVFQEGYISRVQEKRNEKVWNLHSIMANLMWQLLIKCPNFIPVYLAVKMRSYSSLSNINPSVFSQCG